MVDEVGVAGVSDVVCLGMCIVVVVVGGVVGC